MDESARGIDEAIRRAIEAGDFDNLPGRGQPLNMENNPHEDPSWSLALHMLKENGFTPPWIAERQVIESELDGARQKFRQSWEYFQRNPSEEAAWQEALLAFQEQIARLNKRIREFNISVPSDRFQRLTINLQREIDRICHR